MTDKTACTTNEPKTVKQTFMLIKIYLNQLLFIFCFTLAYNKSTVEYHMNIHNYGHDLFKLLILKNSFYIQWLKH